jgi:4,5-dihydroxyphthalate decarboxylase
MSKLRIRYTGANYYDRTRALERGEVQPEGIDLEYVTYANPADLFREMAQTAPYDASEMSLSTYMLQRSRGDDRLVGIPVFPSRAFRHGQVYVSTAAGIERPEDLRGRKVGVPEYQMTAAVWIRAFLEHDYGVAPDQVRWQVGGLKTPGYVERLRHDPPAGVQLQRIPEDRALEEMLAARDIDALLTTDAPAAFRSGDGVERLFGDYRAVEAEYHARTGIFPIMHLVVVRRDVYDANPEVAVALLEAFEEAQRRALTRMSAVGTLAIMHPWIADELARLREQFGGDPWACGVEANRETIAALGRYSVEQGLAERELGPEDLFAPETLDWTAETQAVVQA